MQVYTNKCCREAVKTSDRKKTTVILQPGPAALTDGVQALAAIVQGWAARRQG